MTEPRKINPLSPEYDVRANPDRGVRVHPLPRFMHRRFQSFVREYRELARSHLTTWALARREGCERAYAQQQYTYWQSVIKALNHMEYLGTCNDPAKRTKPTRHLDR